MTIQLDPKRLDLIAERPCGPDGDDGMSPGLVQLLHEAADEIGAAGETTEMAELAEAGAMFLHESALTTEDGTPVDLTVSQAIGYGIMLGWLAHWKDENE